MKTITNVLNNLSIRHLERRTVLGPRLAVIVDAGGGDIGMAEPLLDFGDVGLVIERIRGGCRAQPMGADLEPELCRIGPDEHINAIRCNGFVEPAIAIITDWTEQGAVFVRGVSGSLEIVVDQLV